MTDHSFAENQSELDCCHLKKLKMADVLVQTRDLMEIKVTIKRL